MSVGGRVVGGPRAERSCSRTDGDDGGADGHDPLPMRLFTAAHERAWSAGDIDFSQEPSTGWPSPKATGGCYCSLRASASASAASPTSWHRCSSSFAGTAGPRRRSLDHQGVPETYAEADIVGRPATRCPKMAQSLCYAGSMIEAGRQAPGHVTTAARCAVAGLFLSLMVPAACTQSSDRPASRVLESLVIPFEYPSSPHAWPAGEPIWIECWGDEADRRQARDLALYRRKHDRLSGALEVAEAVADSERTRWANWMIGRATPSELADAKAAYDVAQAEVERLREERESLSLLLLALARGWRDGNHRHPHSAITLRTANGTRYGWSLELASDDVPVLADVEDVFPRDRGLPDFDSLAATEERLEQAVTTGDAAAITRAWTARDDAQDGFVAEREARQRANALRDAIDLDALEACAR